MRLLLAGWLVGAVSAWAGPDTVLFGDGHHGPLVVTTSLVVNRSSTTVTAVAAGSSRVPVSSLVAMSGDLVMLWRLAPDVPLAVSDAGLVDLADNAAGTYELARVANVVGADLVLTAPLMRGVPLGTQVVLVPEYTSVTVTSTGVLRADPWDGLKGGVLAFLVNGVLQNDGLLTAAATGFRGARSVLYPPQEGCLGDSLPPPLGAPAGESFAGPDAGSGQGASLTGGGGGVCGYSGGGGGAHWGAGGRGGNSTTSPVAGGAGGWPVTYEPSTRVLPGGGGGAGWNSVDVYEFESGGRTGGGVVWVRAQQILGAGEFSARGGSGGIYGNGGNAGTCGAGAGGSVILRSQSQLGCTSAHAEGGSGCVGNPNYRLGNGGSGGGGFVWLQGADVRCPASAAGGSPYPGVMGGEAGGLGRVDVIIGGLSGPPAPTMVSPVSGDVVSTRPTVTGLAVPGGTVRLWVNERAAATGLADADGGFVLRPPAPLPVGVALLSASVIVAGLESPQSPLVEIITTTLNDGLHFVSTPRDQAVCGVAYRYSSTGVPVVEPIGELAFSLEGTAPPTMTVDPTTGELNWMPSPQQVGNWSFELVARATGLTARQAIDVVVECPRTQQARVGCGCGNVSQSLGVLGLSCLVLLARRRALRSSPRLRVIEGEDADA